jgi:hypothetical protein
MSDWIAIQRGLAQAGQRSRRRLIYLGLHDIASGQVLQLMHPFVISLDNDGHEILH